MIRIGGVLCIAALAAACAQTEPAPEAPVIRGEPMYDKYGGITGCDGGVYIPGAPPERQCLPPREEDDCIVVVPGTAPPRDSALPPCPPSRQPNDDREPREPQRPSARPVPGTAG